MNNSSLLLAVLALSPLAALTPVAAQGLPPVPVPPGNPITPARADLGKTLFWDEQLSSSRAVACGSCHVPTAGGSDTRSAAAGADSMHPGADGLFGTPDDLVGSPGVIETGADLEYVKNAVFGLAPQVTGRKAPSMINAAFAPRLFWDGRAEGPFLDPVSGAVDLPFGAALEIQSVGPPLSGAEMSHAGQDWSDIVSRVEDAMPLDLSPSIPVSLEVWIAGRDYPQLFTEAFGTPVVSATRIARAIATYERTLISDQSPATLAGPLGIGLTPQERAGMQVFNTVGRCATCHAGPLFTNQVFEYIGVRPILEDLGRGAVTGNPNDNGRMKVPGLLNVDLRAPYFHTGTMATLEGVIDFYDRGGDFFGPTKAPQITPLGLSPPQKADLAAFLRAMTDPRVQAGTAPFDRPTLFGETSLAPSAFGANSPGSGGIAPRLFSVEPPKTANPDFTVAIERGLGGAPAVLAWDLAPAPPGTTLFGVPLHLAMTPAAGHALASLQDAGPGAGYRSLSFALPSAAAMVGVDIFAQGFVIDGGAPSGLAATSGLRITLY